MKYVALIIVLLQFFSSNGFSQRIVKHLPIKQTKLNIDKTKILGKIELEVMEPGRVIAKIDGNANSSPGDRLMIAVNNIPFWGKNEGHTCMESYDEDLHDNNFSHSRVFELKPGKHTFYAVADIAKDEMDGNGITSIYANFTTEFIPFTIGGIVEHKNIAISNKQFNKQFPDVLSKTTININEPGKVVVRFDGTCVSSPGDGIILAASNKEDWDVSNGKVEAFAIDEDVNRNSFAHTMTYSVLPGEHSFYALAQQSYMDFKGTGIASIYGNFIVEFVPSKYQPYWDVNYGNVDLEVFDSIKSKTFSHTRVFELEPGTHNFYAIADQADFEMDGDGIISIYGHLTVKAQADNITGFGNDFEILPTFEINPTLSNEWINIIPRHPNDSRTYDVKVLNQLGETLNSKNIFGGKTEKLNISNYPNGSYFVQIIDKKGKIITNKKIVKM